MPFDFDRLRAQLKRDEGLRLRPYQDSVGVWTAGYGHNLTARGISQAVADLLLEEDMDAVVRDLASLPWFAMLSNVRQRAVANLAFNVGLAGLRTFVRFIAALGAKDYAEAARELEHSRWFGQVGTRGPRLVKMIETGLDPEN